MARQALEEGHLVDRLAEIVGASRLDTTLSVPDHRVGCERNDRKAVPVISQAPSGLIAIEVGLSALTTWKTGYKGLELRAVVAITKVNRLMEEDEVNDIFGGPLESGRDSDRPINAGT